MTIDEAIAHYKWAAESAIGEVAQESKQVAEWLRRARGAEKAARWYTEKIRKLEAENDKLRELVAHLMFVKPNDVSAILYKGELLRFEDMLAEVGMRWESEVPE